MSSSIGDIGDIVASSIDAIQNAQGPLAGIADSLRGPHVAMGLIAEESTVPAAKQLLSASAALLGCVEDAVDAAAVAAAAAHEWQSQL